MNQWTRKSENIKTHRLIRGRRAGGLSGQLASINGCGVAFSRRCFVRESDRATKLGHQNLIVRGRAYYFIPSVNSKESTTLVSSIFTPGWWDYSVKCQLHTLVDSRRYSFCKTKIVWANFVSKSCTEIPSEALVVVLSNSWSCWRRIASCSWFLHWVASGCWDSHRQWYPKDKVRACSSVVVGIQGKETKSWILGS
jgi:hypothetical protein